MINVYVDNVLIVTGEGQDFIRLRDDMETELTWANPDYIKREQMGKWVGNTPRYLTLVQRKGDKEFVLPYGMFRTVWQNYPINYQTAAHINARNTVFKPLPLGEMGLYSYQEKAVREALMRRNGVLVAPCGSGKTQMGLAIFTNLGFRCLWLTHTHELLNQSMSRLKKIFPELSSGIGTITDGKVNAGEYITFATIQTMAKIDLEPLREFWDVIIVDECHKAVGTPTRMTMFWKVISGLSARYKYGLTATPDRNDGLQLSMYALLGEQAACVPREAVRDTTVPLKVHMTDTWWRPDPETVYKPDGTLDYVQLINACCNDELRNTFIVKDILSMDGSVLVLSERIVHLRKLAERCVKPFAILSTANKKARSDAVQDMKDGKIEVLFATYQLAKEGLDIPCLRHLVMASPIKDEIAVTQSAGRVMRKYPDKEYGTVWDYADDTRMLQRWADKRMKIYGRFADDKSES